MASTDHRHTQEIELDIFAQQPRINAIYTQLIFAFRCHHGGDVGVTKVIKILERALDKLHDTFPWTAGHVVKHKGTFSIKLHERPKLFVQDLRSTLSFPGYDDLSTVDFPYTWLDEKIISARSTFAETSELEDGVPVLVLKLNLLNGGFLLSFDCQHGSMDMTGQVQLIRLFAKACRGEEYSTEEVTTGNVERHGVVPELSAEEKQIIISDNHEVSNQHMPPASKSTAPLTWVYYRFTAQSLASMKAQAMEDVSDGACVSTDDVLSAFIWQAISRIRATQVGDDHEISSTLSRNVEGRRCLDLPATYPGLVVTSRVTSKSFAELSRCSTGEIAFGLRKQLDPSQLKRQLQVHAMKTRGGHAVKASTSNPALDVRLSSWAKEDAYKIDFGPAFGAVDAVRTPRFLNGARQGLVYFLPKERNGDIVVGLCLHKTNMLALRNDEAMMKTASYIG
jgi:hypothetical protein